MRIVEVNLNLRVKRGKKPEDYSISKDVSETLCNITPQADIIAMVEYMKCHDKDFLKNFSQNGYTLIEALDDGRGILIGAKSSNVEKIYELSSPHFVHLKLRESVHEVNLIVLRILVGKDISEAEFRDRRTQFLTALDYIKTVSAQNIIIVGDFNNAKIRNNYDGYSQKCYNYQYIIEQFKRLGLRLIPVKGYSHKGYLKEDHIILGKSYFEKSVKYDDTLFPFSCTENSNSIIGYPDHVPLIADIALS